MRVIPDPLFFDWDSGNSNKNFLKHGVSNQEAEEVFGNEPLIIAEDQKHSSSEIRYQALGQTNTNRKLFLSFTIRNQKVRIISIRDMNHKEEKTYDQN
ncbi:MAG: BrnT family toxin [Candidatus Shapirobacteria bacterium]|jgi:hypothetical protein